MMSSLEDATTGQRPSQSSTSAGSLLPQQRSGQIPSQSTTNVTTQQLTQRRSISLVPLLASTGVPQQHRSLSPVLPLAAAQQLPTQPAMVQLQAQVAAQQSSLTPLVTETLRSLSRTTSIAVLELGDFEGIGRTMPNGTGVDNSVADTAPDGEATAAAVARKRKKRGTYKKATATKSSPGNDAMFKALRQGTESEAKMSALRLILEFGTAAQKRKAMKTIDVVAYGKKKKKKGDTAQEVESNEEESEDRDSTSDDGVSSSSSSDSSSSSA
jgi:hypothetical protein